MVTRGKIKTIGTDAKFSVYNQSSNPGTVTSVGLTLGTSGTDASVSGSPITSSGVITLNLPTASAANRGLLSAADWSTFNSKGTGSVTSVSVTTANGVSGSVATATTTPAITLTLGAITPTTVNKVTITAPATGSTLTIADGKTLTVSNSITFTATDGSTLAIGAGGTLGTAAYTASSAYEVPLTFSTGLTRSTNTITNNLSVGVSGGQTIIGGTGVGDGITYKGTTANGTSTAGAHIFNVGNNGGTEAMRILNSAVVLIGATAVAGGEILNATKNQNAATSIEVFNTTAGTASQAYIAANTTGSKLVAMQAFSSSFTTSGSAVANGSRILSTQTANLALVTNNSTAGISFWVNSAEKGRFAPSTGSLLLGTTTDAASSILTMVSTTQGFLPPRMTTTQRDAISSPAAGLVIYNTSTGKLNLFTTAWEAVTSA